MYSQRKYKKFSTEKKFYSLHRNLSHIFRNLDTQFMILDCQLEKPKKASKKDLSLIAYKKTVEINLKKIQNILHHEIKCRCLNCLEDYESLNSTFCNLERKLSEVHDLIHVMKKDEKNMLYLKRVSVVLKKIQQQADIVAK